MRYGLILALVTAPLIALAGGKNIQVKIDGMTCAPCAESVKNALLQLPDIEKDSVQVVLKEKQATLITKNDNPETIEAIKKAVKEAGYTVTAVETAPAAK